MRRAGQAAGTERPAAQIPGLAGEVNSQSNGELIAAFPLNAARAAPACEESESDWILPGGRS
jgi:hypothetical protein